MAHLSRPYQIALGALVVVALMWFVAFGHHSSSSGGSSSSSAGTPPAQSSASASNPSGGSANGSSNVYHGSAPGVEGLSKDIAKAHGAVSTSETYQRHLEEKSAKATATGSGAGTAAGVSGSAPAATVPAGSSAATAPAASAPASTPAAASTTKTAVHAHAPAAKAHAHTPPARTHAATGTHSSPSTHSATPAKPRTTLTAKSGAPSGQRAVEATVKSGKVALLLFWSPSGADDVAVHGQVEALKSAHLPLVVYESNAGDVASFGAITRQVPIYGTPTILIVAAKGHTSSLTGLQDGFSIRQAIEEARSGAS